MAMSEDDHALVACLEAARETIIAYILDPLNNLCGGSPNITVQANQINEINQLLAFLKAK